MGMIKLYGHAGSGNHGCEALVRTTAGIINMPMELYSHSPDQDQLYDVDQIVTIYDDRPIPVKRNSFQYLLAAIDAKFRHSEKLFTEFSHPSFFKRIQKDDICLSIGGDTYCYGKGGRDILAHYNQLIHQRGAKSVLWGCSIDVDVLDDDARRDIASYDLITVREGRSYELLKEVNSNTVKVCDSAFFLEPKILPWPNEFSGNDVVGINVSPLASAGGEAVMDNYLHLIRFILQKTDMKIALIPHVVTGGKDDMSSLNELYQYFEENPRVVDCVKTFL